MFPVLIAALIATATAAGSLSGTWILDPAASESVDEMLKAQGASWAARKVAGAATPTLVITHEGDNVRIVSTTPKGTKTELFHPDGAPHTTKGADGEAQTWTASWEGETLLTVRDVTLGEGEAARLSIRRSRTGGTYVQQVELAIEGGETLRAKRVFQPVTP